MSADKQSRDDAAPEQTPWGRVAEDGTVYVVQVGADYELLATNDLAERALASPAVIEGALILRTQSHLWRVVE